MLMRHLTEWYYDCIFQPGDSDVSDVACDKVLFGESEVNFFFSAAVFMQNLIDIHTSLNSKKKKTFSF